MDKPDNLIDKDKMVLVLIDLSLVSSAKGINKRRLENKGVTPDVYVYKKHISVEFSHGANFSDADLLLEGGGKKRRHLKITSYDDIHIKNTKYYIQQAIN